MNEPIGRFSPFFATMRGEPEPRAVEAWLYSDGLVAVAIGCASVLTCGLAAIAISLGYLLGRAT